ncbi:hypothetical protein IFM89_001455 [Coptis chinensis]|uniref:Uncharacterized protein n=1 Tax=Coptis chinensis TaxID=261450 RepID=A0A835GVQ9_9MAGN|nr:hypothetical protein IFM89_001455 [Coptis chinensis]
MMVRWSTQECSNGQRFLRCNRAPRCSCFKWIDLGTCEAKGKVVDVVDAKEKDKPKKEGKLKLCIDGAIKMHIEGSVSDITELVKKLTMVCFIDKKRPGLEYPCWRQEKKWQVSNHIEGSLQIHQRRQMYDLNARDPTRSQSHGDSSRGMELCELINMHREVVAKGRATRANIILDATLDTLMDIYNVRVCLVIDRTERLFGSKRTFGELHLPTAVKWPKDFTRFL